jgi:hypothetical protein
MQTTDARERSIRTLLEIRESAAQDLAIMPSFREGTEWAQDRYNDIAACNRQLARLGYFPPHVKA